jgi:hypothetical protein
MLERLIVVPEYPLGVENIEITGIGFSGDV